MSDDLSTAARVFFELATRLPEHKRNGQQNGTNTVLNDNKSILKEMYYENICVLSNLAEKEQQEVPDCEEL
jgi:hypothetical protein